MSIKFFFFNTTLSRLAYTALPRSNMLHIELAPEVLLNNKLPDLKVSLHISGAKLVYLQISDYLVRLVSISASYLINKSRPMRAV